MEEPEIPEKKISATTTTNPKPPLDVSHEVLGEQDQPLRNPPLFHESPGEDEQRYGQKRERVDPGIELQGHRGDGNSPLPEQGQDAGQGHGERHGDIDHQE